MRDETCLCRAHAPLTVYHFAEDSGIGLGAANAAGIACLVTKSYYTDGEDFTKANMVVQELGDEPGVTLQTLEGLLP
jgi:hypothetical protein